MPACNTMCVSPMAPIAVLTTPGRRDPHSVFLLKVSS